MVYYYNISQRNPIIGDKFASRAGQKGICRYAPHCSRICPHHTTPPTTHPHSQRWPSESNAFHGVRNGTRHHLQPSWLPLQNDHWYDFTMTPHALTPPPPSPGMMIEMMAASPLPSMVSVMTALHSSSQRRTQQSTTSGNY